MTSASRHPEEAKKLLAFLLSETVQKSVYTEAFGLPVRDAVADEIAGDNGELTPSGLLNGVRIWEPEWTEVLGALDYDLAAYRKAVGA